MSTNDQRERRAFEGIVVNTLRNLETSDVDATSIRPANDKELDAFSMVRNSGFLERLTAGEIDEESDSLEEQPNAADGQLACSGGTLFRSDGLDVETSDALDEADRLIIERKKRERQDGEAS